MTSLALTTRPFLAAVNHLLAAAPWARARLAPHAGRAACLCVDPLRLRFAVTPDGSLTPDNGADPAAVTLMLPLAALPQLLGGDHDKAMANLRIEGAADFADALGFVFRNLRWDVEEDLSRVFGDIVAHRLVDGARELHALQRRTLDAVGGNLAEYFAEEQAFLVTRAAFASHSDGVQALRDDIARLAKRLDRLAVARR